jgi:hypothetical protein
VQNTYLIFGEGMFEEQSVAAGEIYGHIKKYELKARRGFFPRHPPVTEINCRNCWEMKQRGHRLDMMLAVNDIGRNGKQSKIIYYGHGCSSQLFGHFAKTGAVSYWSMTALDQPCGQIAHIQFRPGSHGERVVGDEHSHQHFLSA